MSRRDRKEGLSVVYRCGHTRQVWIPDHEWPGFQSRVGQHDCADCIVKRLERRVMEAK